jgi:dienelactone hydrolase
MPGRGVHSLHHPTRPAHLLASLLLLAALVAGCAGIPDDVDQARAFYIAQFQPPIVADAAPARPLRGSWSLANNTRRVGLADMRPIVPSFDGHGHLLASWNPHPDGAAGRPTFVIVHGGHGLVTTNFATALWLRDALGANTLLLDSYWSRGHEENWRSWTEFGANMRALDAIAAGRWLRDVQGTDPAQTFLLGDSQGGWTVLRSFTDERFLRTEVTPLYRAGVALYPNCRSDGTPLRPPLGPYSAPVIVFTGGRDTATPISECSLATLRQAQSWIHYPHQTHSWDVANRGAHTPAVDGECSRAMNTFNPFLICRSDRTTADMRAHIIAFVSGL